MMRTPGRCTARHGRRRKMHGLRPASDMWESASPAEPLQQHLPPLPRARVHAPFHMPTTCSSSAPASTAPLPRDRREMRPCGYRSLIPPLACESINLPVPPNVVQELPSTSCSTSLPVLLRSVQPQCRLSCRPDEAHGWCEDAVPNLRVQRQARVYCVVRD